MNVLLAYSLVLLNALPASAETLSVYVRDRLTGAPIPNAIIVLVGEAPIVRTVVADENGEAHIEVMATERLSLSIRSPRHGTSCFAVDGTSSRALTAELDESVRLGGTIRDSEGRPLPSALIRVSYEADPACRVMMTPQPIRADANGWYQLRNLDFSRRFAIAFETDRHERLVLERADVMRVVNLRDLKGSGAVQSARGDLNVTLRRK